MRNPTAVIDLDVTQSLTLASGYERYRDAEVLCRLQDRPLGFVHASIEQGTPDVDAAIRHLVAELTPACGVALAERAIASGRPPRWPDASGLVQLPLRPATTGPLVTVAVCVRDAAHRLRECLDSLMNLAYNPVDVLVVDNQSVAGEVEAIVRDFPSVRYVHESSDGLECARNRALAECRGDILAFTDADIVVDRFWLASMVRVFLADAEVVAVAGLVVPQELDVHARKLIEAHRFGRSFQRQWYRGSATSRACDRERLDQIGVTANLAFWRRALEDGGGFHAEEDALLGVLDAGHTVVFEPAAICWSRELPVRPEFVAAGHVVQRLLSSASDALRVARQRLTESAPCEIREVARRLDLADPLHPIADAADADRLVLTVAWDGVTLGSVVIEHRGAVVSTMWLTDAIAQGLTAQVLDARTKLGERVLWSAITASLAQALLPALEKWRAARARAAQPPHVSKAA